MEREPAEFSQRIRDLVSAQSQAVARRSEENQATLIGKPERDAQAKLLENARREQLPAIANTMRSDAREVAELLGTTIGASNIKLWVVTKKAVSTHYDQGNSLKEISPSGRWRNVGLGIGPDGTIWKYHDAETYGFPPEGRLADNDNVIRPPIGMVTINDDFLVDANLIDINKSDVADQPIVVQWRDNLEQMARLAVRTHNQSAIRRPQ